MRQASQLALSLVLVLAASAGLAPFHAAPAAGAVETRRVPTAEGIELATDIYHPEEEPAPVVLVRTPYGRRGFAFLAEALAREGYVVAMQDVRGKYDSDGEHEPFRHERADGVATLRWIAKQPWCNGRIGMWGSSYGGYAALTIADVELEAFRSIFSISGWLDVEQVVRPGGANHLMLNLAWMLSQQGRTQRSLSEFDVDALFRHTPMRDALRAAGIRNATWEDPSWLDEMARRGTKLGQVKRPVFQLTGWHDMVYRAALDAWRSVAAGSDGSHKLAIGPWYHNQFLFESWEVGDAHFGKASGFGTAEMIALAVEWFDATLKGEINGMLQRPPVTYFLMGQNAWHAAESWPPAGGVEAQPWYLGDGTLSRRRNAKPGESSFVFDPLDPVPTLGGANFFYFPEKLGVRDQREIGPRDDVLAYTSAPLGRRLQITGPVRAHLRVATSAPDTDFTAKLVVIRPDGYERIVEEGITRLSRRPGPRPTPGQAIDLVVDLGHTALQVPAGQRLRLDVSSSNFPKYDRNPNTGEDPYLAAELRPARQTVFHGGDAGSWLELPVREQTLTANAAAHEPLVRPVEEPESVVEVAAGSDADKLLAQGREQLDADETDEAIASLERAAELAPDSSETHFWLGRAYLDKLQSASMFKKLGLSKKVRTSYLRAIELDPKNLDARSSLASFYFNAPAIAGGSETRGLEQVEALKKLDVVRAHLLLAGLHVNKERPREAEREFRAAIAANPEGGDAYYGLGRLFQEERRWDEAFEAFGAGVRKTGDPQTLYQVGRTAVLSGTRLERGQAAFEQFIAEGKDSNFTHFAHWRLGMLFELRGEPELARRQYEAALELDPALDRAKEALKELDKAAAKRRDAGR